ncbi:right-handed parallel beta-helix repeat-containing protein [bacterium]|nr:right-handed parallel beta-helix repeat-containing protein [bacterium]
MKKNYFLLLVTMLLGLGSFAQLSGSYTINGATATGGTNYQTFQAAVSALNTSGVSGPVTFNVAAGTYTGEVLIGTITGASATNTITFDGGTAGATIVNNTSSSSTGTIRFLNASYTTFMDLNINAGTGYGRVVYFDGSNDFITFKKCNVTTRTGTSSAYACFYNESGTTNLSNNITIDSCVMTNGYYGAGYFYGGNTSTWEQNLTFTNNTVQDFYLYGVYAYYQENMVMSNNEFNQLSSATSSGYGPYFRAKSSEVSYNKINLFSTGTQYGLTPYYCDGTAAAPTRVFNNMVRTSSTGTGTRYGARIYNCKFTDFQYNTLSGGTTTGTHYGMYHYGTATYGPNNIQNNIVTTDAGGSNHYAVYFASSGAAINTLDNNLYYSYGTITNQFYWGSARADLTALQTASSKEISSIWSDPQYLSPTDLHLQGTAANGTAAVITGITDDIDGNVRNTTTPDIGADEYTPPTCPASSALIGFNPTGTTHDVAWTAATAATSWLVEYGAPGFTPGTGTVVPSTNDTLTLTGLTPQTDYEFYVVGICGPGDSSISAGPGAIRTACLFTLNGAYTVDPAAAASSTNFVSLQALFQTLEDCGMSGPSVVTVAAGSGPHIMNWDLNGINGLNGTNTLTIDGNGTTVNRGAGNYFLALDGITHLTIENFMFVNETPASNVFGIMLRGGCDSVTIKNNTIDLGLVSTSSLTVGIVATNSLTSVFSYGNNANNLTIDNNTIIGGYYGIRLNGTSTSVKATGNKIINNTIEDVYLYAMYNYYADDLLIHNNDISRGNRTSLSTFYGIYAYYSTKTVISNNKIHNSGTGSYTAYPIYFGQSSNTAANPSFIVNNAIYDIGPNGTGTFYGMYLVSTMSYINVWHNTIDKNTDGSTGTHRGIYRSSTPNNENYTNNLVSIYGSGTGTKYCYYSNSSATFTGGNNLFYMGATAGTNNTAYFSGNQATIAAWSTATSTTGNSDVNPSIVAGGYTPLAGPADNGGTPLPLVTIDIDSAMRNAVTPDFGAVEFVGLPGDMSITDAWLEEVDACYGMADSAYATISNDFGSLVDFTNNPLTINWTTTGPVADGGSLIVNTGTLAVGASMDFYIASIDMSIPGTYTVSANIGANTVNASSLNDTLNDHNTFDKKALIAVNPKSDTVVLTLGDSVKISTQSPFFPGGAFFITEVCQFAGSSTGRPTPARPSWHNADDYVEITGVPGSDLAGITIEQWTTSSLTASHTFPAGTVLGPDGTATIATYQGTASPSNFFYIALNNSTSSGTATGRLLKDASGNIMDAVGYGTTYTFPGASGVTASDWSGNHGSSSGSWGVRLEGADVNSPTNWVKSNISPQTPSVINAGVPVPSPSSVAGLQWSDVTGLPILLDTTPEIYAKGWTSNGLYQYEATFVTPCGTFSDTSDILVLLQTFDTTAITVCDTFTTPMGGVAYTNSGFYTDTTFGTAIVYDSIIHVYDVTVNYMSSETILVAICDSFQVPSGVWYNTTGIYQDTIPNALGCDSVITVDLTITTTTFIMDTVFACDSNDFRGMNLTTAGTYYDTVFTGSCDSIYIRTLTMGYASFVTFNQFECDSFVSPTGKVWNTDGMYMDTILNASGCDSNMVFNLTFGYISYANFTVTRCDSFVSPSGKVWNTTGTYLDTIVNVSGCDSAMTYAVTINYSASRTDNIALCAGIPHRVGPTLYRTAGTYTDVFQTRLGCDSTIITNLSYFAPAVATINYNFCIGDSVQVLSLWYYSANVIMDTIVGGSSNGCDSITTHNITTRTVSPALNLGADVTSCLDGGVTIFASNAYDTYNWSNGGTTNVLSVTGAMAGSGSTDHILTVTQASSGCSARDTVNITFQSCVGLNEVDADLNVNLYPNPASNFVTIEVFDKYNTGDLRLEIMNSLGQVISSRSITNSNEKIIMDVNNFSKGLYFVRISSDKVYMTKKLLIQK